MIINGIQWQLKNTNILTINWSSISDINRLIVIDYHRLLSIISFIDWPCWDENTQKNKQKLFLNENFVQLSLCWHLKSLMHTIFALRRATRKRFERIVHQLKGKVRTSRSDCSRESGHWIQVQLYLCLRKTNILCSYSVAALIKHTNVSWVSFYFISGKD